MESQDPSRGGHESGGSGPHVSGPHTSGPFDFAGQGDGPLPADPVNLPTGLYSSEGQPLPTPPQQRGSRTGAIVTALALVLLLAGGAVVYLLAGRGGSDETNRADPPPSPPSQTSSSIVITPPSGPIPTAAPRLRAADRRKLQQFVLGFVRDGKTGRCEAAWAKVGEIEREDAFNSRRIFCSKVLPGVKAFPPLTRCVFSRGVTPEVECQFGPQASVRASYELDTDRPIVDFFFTPTE